MRQRRWGPLLVVLHRNPCREYLLQSVLGASFQAGEWDEPGEIFLLLCSQLTSAIRQLNARPRLREGLRKAGVLKGRPQSVASLRCSPPKREGEFSEHGSVGWASRE
jgi:hypothetical protein